MKFTHLMLGITLLMLAHSMQAQASKDVRLSCKPGHEERCKQIVDIFKAALIAESTNIFALREVFFPSREYPLNSFLIHYIISLSHFNGSTSKVYKMSEIVDWCKSSVSLQASPIMLQTLFSGLNYITHYALNEHYRFNEIIILKMNISDKLIPGGISNSEITYAVEYLTPWVS